VLHEQPGREGAVLAYQRLARPTLGRDDLLHAVVELRLAGLDDAIERSEGEIGFAVAPAVRMTQARIRIRVDK
jgi:hypothetical protein